jgi:hypothetical protein
MRNCSISWPGPGAAGFFLASRQAQKGCKKLIDKRLDPERAEEVIDAADRAGIGSTVSLITGFPEQTWEDFRQTIRIFFYSARYPKSHPQLNLLAPPGRHPAAFQTQARIGPRRSLLGFVAPGPNPE